VSPPMRRLLSSFADTSLCEWIMYESPTTRSGLEKGTLLLSRL
jgi:hypothetical protein